MQKLKYFMILILNQTEVNYSMLGFIPLNKPFGFTSHDCVAKVRRFLNIKKVGMEGL